MNGDKVAPDTCAVDGCQDDAIARLFDHPRPGPRCRECLVFDLDAGADR